MFFIPFRVQAGEPQLTFEGEALAEAGQTKKINAKISSDTDVIGLVSGAVKYNECIQKIEVKGLNGWSVTYNAETGAFNAVKPEGTKNEAFMEVTYTVKEETAGTACITISGIKLTTTEYTTKELTSVSKNVVITKNGEKIRKLTSIEIVTPPSKTTYVAGEKFDTAGMVIKAVYDDGTSQNVTGYLVTPNGALKETDNKVGITYTENGIKKQVEQKISVSKALGGEAKGDDASIAPTDIPQTGVNSHALQFISVAGLTGIISFSLYRKYREI